MSQDTESRIAVMEAKLQTLETFLPALLSRFEQDSREARQERKESEAKLETKLAQNAQESRQDRKELEARLEQASREMREVRRAAFYFGIGTIIALFTLAAAVYFGFQNLGAGA